eukprot:TRINITY_DN1123_c0_g1_i1.p1 TRINITY_DN1123_c0_g1~~TRINITY_DN1123_c0_g1_i1.p1  ORF type:complete len:2881 (-),score=1090.50 TRINITY_DN1123_c0_g1_i1:212-8854(-)
MDPAPFYEEPSDSDDDNNDFLAFNTRGPPQKTTPVFTKPKVKKSPARDGSLKAAQPKYVSLDPITPIAAKSRKSRPRSMSLSHPSTVKKLSKSHIVSQRKSATPQKRSSKTNGKSEESSIPLNKIISTTKVCANTNNKTKEAKEEIELSEISNNDIGSMKVEKVENNFTESAHIVERDLSQISNESINEEEHEMMDDGEAVNRPYEDLPVVEIDERSSVENQLVEHRENGEMKHATVADNDDNDETNNRDWLISDDDDNVEVEENDNNETNEMDFECEESKSIEINDHHEELPMDEVESNEELPTTNEELPKQQDELETIEEGNKTKDENIEENIELEESDMELFEEQDDDDDENEKEVNDDDENSKLQIKANDNDDNSSKEEDFDDGSSGVQLPELPDGSSIVSDILTHRMVWRPKQHKSLEKFQLIGADTIECKCEDCESEPISGCLTCGHSIQENCAFTRLMDLNQCSTHREYLTHFIGYGPVWDSWESEHVLRKLCRKQGTSALDDYIKNGNLSKSFNEVQQEIAECRFTECVDSVLMLKDDLALCSWKGLSAKKSTWEKVVDLDDKTDKVTKKNLSNYRFVMKRVKGTSSPLEVIGNGKLRSSSLQVGKGAVLRFVCNGSLEKRSDELARVLLSKIVTTTEESHQGVPLSSSSSSSSGIKKYNHAASLLVLPSESDVHQVMSSLAQLMRDWSHHLVPVKYIGDDVDRQLLREVTWGLSSTMTGKDRFRQALPHFDILVTSHEAFEADIKYISLVPWRHVCVECGDNDDVALTSNFFSSINSLINDSPLSRRLTIISLQMKSHIIENKAKWMKCVSGYVIDDDISRNILSPANLTPSEVLRADIRSVVGEKQRDLMKIAQRECPNDVETKRLLMTHAWLRCEKPQPFRLFDLLNKDESYHSKDFLKENFRYSGVSKALTTFARGLFAASREVGSSRYCCMFVKSAPLYWIVTNLISNLSKKSPSLTCPPNSSAESLNHTISQVVSRKARSMAILPVTDDASVLLNDVNLMVLNCGLFVGFEDDKELRHKIEKRCSDGNDPFLSVGLSLEGYEQFIENGELPPLRDQRSFTESLKEVAHSIEKTLSSYLPKMDSTSVNDSHSDNKANVDIAMIRDKFHEIELKHETIISQVTYSSSSTTPSSSDESSLSLKEALKHTQIVLEKCLEAPELDEDDDDDDDEGQDVKVEIELLGKETKTKIVNVEIKGNAHSNVIVHDDDKDHVQDIQDMEIDESKDNDNKNNDDDDDAEYQISNGGNNQLNTKSGEQQEEEDMDIDENLEEKDNEDNNDYDNDDDEFDDELEDEYSGESTGIDMSFRKLSFIEQQKKLTSFVSSLLPKCDSKVLTNEIADVFHQVHGPVNMKSDYVQRARKHLRSQVWKNIADDDIREVFCRLLSILETNDKAPVTKKQFVMMNRKFDQLRTLRRYKMCKELFLAAYGVFGERVVYKGPYHFEDHGIHRPALTEPQMINVLQNCMFADPEKTFKHNVTKTMKENAIVLMGKQLRAVKNGTLKDLDKASSSNDNEYVISSGEKASLSTSNKSVKESRKSTKKKKNEKKEHHHDMIDEEGSSSDDEETMPLLGSMMKNNKKRPTSTKSTVASSTSNISSKRRRVAAPSPTGRTLSLYDGNVPKKTSSTIKSQGEGGISSTTTTTATTAATKANDDQHQKKKDSIVITSLSVFDKRRIRLCDTLLGSLTHGKLVEVDSSQQHQQKNEKTRYIRGIMQFQNIGKALMDAFTKIANVIKQHETILRSSPLNQIVLNRWCWERLAQIRLMKSKIRANDITNEVIEDLAKSFKTSAQLQKRVFSDIMKIVKSEVLSNPEMTCDDKTEAFNHFFKSVLTSHSSTSLESKKLNLPSKRGDIHSKHKSSSSSGSSSHNKTASSSHKPSSSSLSTPSSSSSATVPTASSSSNTIKSHSRHAVAKKMQKKGESSSMSAALMMSPHIKQRSNSSTAVSSSSLSSSTTTAATSSTSANNATTSGDHSRRGSTSSRNRHHDTKDKHHQHHHQSQRKASSTSTSSTATSTTSTTTPPPPAPLRPIGQQSSRVGSGSSSVSQKKQQRLMPQPQQKPSSQTRNNDGNKGSLKPDDTNTITVATTTPKMAPTKKPSTTPNMPPNTHTNTTPKQPPQQQHHQHTKSSSIEVKESSSVVVILPPQEEEQKEELETVSKQKKEIMDDGSTTPIDPPSSYSSSENRTEMKVSTTPKIGPLSKGENEEPITKDLKPIVLSSSSPLLPPPSSSSSALLPEEGEEHKEHKEHKEQTKVTTSPRLQPPPPKITSFYEDQAEAEAEAEVEQHNEQQQQHQYRSHHHHHHGEDVGRRTRDRKGSISSVFSEGNVSMDLSRDVSVSRSQMMSPTRVMSSSSNDKSNSSTTNLDKHPNVDSNQKPTSTSNKQEQQSSQKEKDDQSKDYGKRKSHSDRDLVERKESSKKAGNQRGRRSRSRSRSRGKDDRSSVGRSRRRGGRDRDRDRDWSNGRASVSDRDRDRSRGDRRQSHHRDDISNRHFTSLSHYGPGAGTSRGGSGKDKSTVNDGDDDLMSVSTRGSHHSSTTRSERDRDGRGDRDSSSSSVIRRRSIGGASTSQRQKQSSKTKKENDDSTMMTDDSKNKKRKRSATSTTSSGSVEPVIFLRAPSRPRNTPTSTDSKTPKTSTDKDKDRMSTSELDIEPRFKRSRHHEKGERPAATKRSDRNNKERSERTNKEKDADKSRGRGNERSERSNRRRSERSDKSDRMNENQTGSKNDNKRLQIRDNRESRDNRDKQHYHHRSDEEKDISRDKSRRHRSQRSSSMVSHDSSATANKSMKTDSSDKKKDKLSEATTKSMRVDVDVDEKKKAHQDHDDQASSPLVSPETPSGNLSAIEKANKNIEEEVDFDVDYEDGELNI